MPIPVIHRGNALGPQGSGLDSVHNMERVTWGGVALHAGQLPGYPASHGCVRLPVDFAEKLYTVTQNGTTVIVADDRSAPHETVHPGLLFPATVGQLNAPTLTTGGDVWRPEFTSSHVAV